MIKFRVALVTVAAVLLGGIAHWFSISATEPISLPVIAPAPAFEFISEKGEQVNTEDLRGKVTMLNFFFTRCGSICPALNGRIAGLARTYKNDPYVHFVSISVDPEFDSVDVLSEYAKRFQSNPEQWDFLTGEKSAVSNLRREGLKLDNGETIELHTTRIVLIDPELRVRGFYQGTEDEEVKRLARDLQTLLPVVN